MRDVVVFTYYPMKWSLNPIFDWITNITIKTFNSFHIILNAKFWWVLWTLLTNHSSIHSLYHWIAVQNSHRIAVRLLQQLCADSLHQTFPKPMYGFWPGSITFISYIVLNIIKSAEQCDSKIILQLLLLSMHIPIWY